MPNHLGDMRVSRRTFLRRFGVAAGALAAGQLISACSNNSAANPTHSLDQASKLMVVNGPAAQTDTLRVGLLLPQSQIYPATTPISAPAWICSWRNAAALIARSH
jgi:hypothetical protein